MIRVVQDWLRVEYGGDSLTPARIVVPVAFDKGNYSDIQICVRPRSGIRLKQQVETGDAFVQTFTKSWTNQTGASFFGSVGVGHSSSVQTLPYSVVSLPDFQGVLFKLNRFKADTQIGIQVAFLIESYSLDPRATAFAEVTLSLEGSEMERHTVPQEMHPRAAEMLLIDGLSRPANRPVQMPRPPFGPFINAKPVLSTNNRETILSSIASGCDIVHVVASVESGFLNFSGTRISPVDLFHAMDLGEAKLVYLATCNSVEVVSHFRNSTASTLIAATQNLGVHYAEVFESYFYESLACGYLVSASFDYARRKTEAHGLNSPFRSSRGIYNPMFLDLKRDISFRPLPS